MGVSRFSNIGMSNTFQILRFFLPLQNPVGFTLPDAVLFGVAALALACILLRDQLAQSLRALARHPGRAAAMLVTLPIALRLALLPHHPIPAPAVSDDFAYLLLGDTFAHFRLANPTHPMHRFFETVFVLQQPSYASIFPPGQGLVLAFGQLVFGVPWVGIALSIGVFCASVYWTLRGWLSPTWALVGGLLAVMMFGPLNQWMNNYWGGAVSGIAGCLIFGAVPRLRRLPTTHTAILLGLGLSLQGLSRPFEAALVGVCLVPFVFQLRRRHLLTTCLTLLPAILLTLAHNHAVTGHWTRLPYMESRSQYGIPAAFTFQKMPQPSRPLVREQEMDFEAQRDTHATAGNYWARLAGRLKFLRFFLYAPLYVALLFWLPRLRERRFQWAAGCVVVLFFGTNFYPYFYPHYLAVIACLLLLFAAEGLARMPRALCAVVLILCFARFAAWYGIHLLGDENLYIATDSWQSWDYVNFGDFEGRQAIERELAAEPGRQLVFVRYSPSHTLREWLYNDADIDKARIVRALDLGAEENTRLQQYYPDRRVWMLEPDRVPPRLTPYPSPGQ